MNTPRTTIRWKLITAMMLTSTSVLLLTGAALIVYDTVSFRQSLAATVTTRAQILAANATAALAFENREDADQILGSLKSAPSTVMAVLYDRHGNRFASYSVSPHSALAPERPSGSGYRFERSAIVVVQPVMEGGRFLGTLYLESDLKALTVRRRVFALVLFMAVLGSLAVALAISTWLQRGIATPVRALADSAKRVTNERDYSVRAAVSCDDEIGYLAGAFNGMLGDIQQRDTALRASEAKLKQFNAELEQRVRARTVELETANREMEAFSYSVSHDLRAPLRHIDGFADLLRRHTETRLDEKSRRYIDTISESAKSMGALIDDLLSFSRMGRSEMRQTLLSLESVVAEVRGTLSTESEEREIVWDIRPLPDIYGDVAMLRLAITNLLSNAVKYTRGRDPARIEIGTFEQESETVLFVKDNGAGFDMAYQHKLFGVFQRLHSSDDFEGTGIGLANVRRIVQRHGGRVWAEGKPGEGATFFMAVPKTGATTVEHREAA